MRKGLFLLLMLLPIVASAHDFEVDGIYYNIINENEVGVTYKGTYTLSAAYSGEVVIPENVTYDGVTYLVTSIGNHAFENCKNLSSIVLPNSVTTIKNRAFYCCITLTNIEIGNSVTIIGDEVFSYCRALTSIEMPNSITSIGSSTFKECNSLTTVNIPNSVTSISDMMFYYCSALINVNIPNCVTYIGNHSFRFCDLININLPDSLISIGECAFEGCKMITSIEIPNTVTSIGAYAFSTTGLKDVIIPNSIRTINNGVFYQCHELKSIKIPNTVSSFGIEAFCYCRNLKSVEIPNSVTTIGRAAFYQCESLNSIEIPNSVTSIGEHAFYNCNGLRNVTIPESVKSIGEKAFNAYSGGYINNVTLLGDIDSVGTNVFPTLSRLVISSKVTALPDFGFSANSIYSYGTIPPTCQNGSFSSYYGTLHVPASSLAAYFIAPIWEHFNNMVGDAVEPERVSINQDSVEVNLGNQFTLTATVSPTNATPNNITWKSTNTRIATVYNGVVSAVGIGECDIIAECLYRRDTCHVVVNDTTVIITLDQQEAMVLPNHIITLTPSASPIMPALTVSSSDPSVAAARVVNNKIQVVGIKEGTTTITVGSVDGTAIPATCLVTVYTEPGDINCDGFVNISDVTDLIDYLLSGDSSQISTKNADVNGDESINISDVTTLIDILLSGNG